MKLEDIVQQLQAKLPRFTSAVSTVLAVVSASHASDVATITTEEEHCLAEGDVAAFEGFGTSIAITNVALDAATLIGTLTTASNHDATENDQDRPNVKLTGSGGVYDGEFPILTVANRQTLTVQFTADGGSGAIAGLVSFNLANVFNSLRGAFGVASIVSPKIFTVALTDPPSDLGTLNVDDADLRVKPRISAAVDADAVFKAYSSETTGGIGKTWIFVVPEDFVVSRDRDTGLDVIASQILSGDFRHWLIMPFTVLVGFNATDMEMGRAAFDSAHDLRRPILQCLLGFGPETGLALNGSQIIQFVGDATAAYDNATYWHAFSFSQLAQVSDDDAVKDDHVAFRDANITYTADSGQDLTKATTPMTDALDLDEEPLP